MNANARSDVTAVSKDIVALRKQGMTATQGSAHGSLLAMRDSTEVNAELDQKPTGEFSDETKTRHLFVLIPKGDDMSVVNTLLYDLAAYNFSKFMIKEFDLEVNRRGGKDVVMVTGFDTYDEVRWYESVLMAEPLFQGRITLDKMERYLISDENMKLINTLGWDSYKQYLEESSKRVKTKKKK